MTAYLTDFVIVTPLEEERDAVLSRLPGHRKLPPSEDDIRVYYEAEVPVRFSDGTSSSYSVVAVTLAKMGHTEAASATGDAIRRWRPRFVLLVGIAGGVGKAGVKLGDVLIADQVADYELQKVSDSQTSIRWQVHRVDQRLFIASQNFSDRAWARTASPRPKQDLPEVHFGPICTGNKVIANEAMTDPLREVWAKLIGVEMEASGVANSAFQAARATGFFMIRGVSDLADGRKDSKRVKGWRPYACEITAAYAIEFLKNGPVPAAHKVPLKPSPVVVAGSERELVRPTQPPTKSWSPAVLYPLQPAPYFAGREALLKELSVWATAPDDPNRVVALVATGGTGKTATAERVLASVKDYTAAGVFVWSFYENPKTEAFLRAACEYILGEIPWETGGLLEQLQQGLTGTAPHLLILDGLELVQSTGIIGQPRGELEDPLMKRFLRWMAAGVGTRTKALITSRFALPDLENWKRRGFRAIELDDLDPVTAREVLRKWAVTGTDATLDVLTNSVHRHALTLDVLGSYLGTFHGGDPTQAPSFAPECLVGTDSTTAKLHRVLTSYAERMSAKERDLLVVRQSSIDG
jgi:nucleoside phosphorylase